MRPALRAEERFPLGSPPGTPERARWRRWTRVPRWSGLHEQVSRHPVFAGCTRSEIRQIVRWGDAVDVEGGQMICREDRIGYWFVAVLSGEVALTRRRHGVETVGPGGHLGVLAILGGGPQPATAVTAGPCRLFFVGRQRMTAIAYTVPGVQEALFHTSDPSEVQSEIRRLRTEGTEAWRRVPRAPRTREQSGRDGRMARRPGATRGTARPPGRRVGGWRPGTASPRPASAQLPVRTVATPLAIMLALTLAALMAFWHPPVAVISPGTPIDVTDEVAINGATTYPVNGHYVLTPVKIDRPTLGGLVLARLQGRRIERVDSDGSDPAASRRAGARAFADAQRHAVAAAAETLGLRPSDLGVRFGRHELTGPSAGLVYAITLLDLLTPEDLALGRTIAATGELAEDGGVFGVGFVGVKAQAAQDDGAVLFLVPAGQGTSRRGLVIREVASLEDALALLRE